MFNRHEDRIDALETQMRNLIDTVRGPGSLYDRLSTLEKDLAPLRIGDKPLWVGYPEYDARQRVTLREAVTLILQHLGLRVKKLDAVPERYEMEKIEKSAR